MTVSDEKAMTFFGEAGFEFWNTGGNCTAFGRRLSDDEDGPHILVTSVYDGEPEASHPDDSDTQVAVCWAPDSESEGECVICDSWDEAVDIAIGLAERHDA